MKKRTNALRFVLLSHCLAIVLPVLILLWFQLLEESSLFRLLWVLFLINLTVFEMIAISLIQRIQRLKQPKINQRHLHEIGVTIQPKYHF